MRQSGGRFQEAWDARDTHTGQDLLQGTLAPHYIKASSESLFHQNTMSLNSELREHS